MITVSIVVRGAGDMQRKRTPTGGLLGDTQLGKGEQAQLLTLGLLEATLILRRGRRGMAAVAGEEEVLRPTLSSRAHFVKVRSPCTTEIEQ